MAPYRNPLPSGPLSNIVNNSHTKGAIELPETGQEYEPGTMCTVSGWGEVSAHIFGYANVLQKVGKEILHYV